MSGSYDNSLFTVHKKQKAWMISAAAKMTVTNVEEGDENKD